MLGLFKFGLPTTQTGICIGNSSLRDANIAPGDGNIRMIEQSFLLPKRKAHNFIISLQVTRMKKLNKMMKPMVTIRSMRRSLGFLPVTISMRVINT